MKRKTSRRRSASEALFEVQSCSSSVVYRTYLCQERSKDDTGWSLLPKGRGGADIFASRAWTWLWVVPASAVLPLEKGMPHCRSLQPDVQLWERPAYFHAPRASSVCECWRQPPAATRPRGGRPRGSLVICGRGRRGDHAHRRDLRRLQLHRHQPLRRFHDQLPLCLGHLLCRSEPGRRHVARLAPAWPCRSPPWRRR